MIPRRSIDTAPHPDLRWYSTGNFAEVAPARWSVMSWSLVGDPAERGLRAFTARLTPNARWATGTHYVFVGYFACRPYHNLSALCQIANELPGPDDEDVTRAYFEGVPPPERELGRHCSTVQRILALPRMAREFHRLRPRLAELEADVAICEEEITTALASGWGLALGRAAERALRVVDEASDLHYSTSGSLVPAGAIQRKVGERLLPRWQELEPLVNRPRELPWSRLFDAVGGPELEESRFLAASFYEAADAFEPWTTYARAFRPHAPHEHEHGRRGPEQEEVAEVVWRMYRGMRRVGIEQVSRAVADTMQAREESKALTMRCLHLFRRALPALAEEAGVEDDGWAYLRIRELLSAVRRPQLERLVAARRREVDEALTEDMPDELVVPHPADGGAPPRRTADRPRRTPSGVSPGVVAGMVATLDQAAAGGETNGKGPVILVCESADAGIQSLLPHVAGLITLRGSMLSHIATLAREYGIPTVVNHPLAETLRAGQHVVLNGSTGEVEVIS